MYYENLGNPVNNWNTNLNDNNMYTTDVMVPLSDNTSVLQLIYTLASMVVLMVPCILKRDLVLQISHFPTQGNLFDVNHTNVFATRPTVTINQCSDINMLTIRMPQNLDEFVRIVEQFTGWQTEFDSYETTLGD